MTPTSPARRPIASDSVRQGAIQTAQSPVNLSFSVTYAHGGIAPNLRNRRKCPRNPAQSGRKAAQEASVDRKLIVFALPLEAINEAAATEKSIRHGHLSMLHLWWARRPFQRELDFGVTSVNYALDELQVRAEAPG